MILDLDEKNLKAGVLSLVIALVELIKETLRLQALKRVESGSLTKGEMERLGEALMDLEEVIEKIKVELGVAEAVRSIREDLDTAVEKAIEALSTPGLRQMVEQGG